MLALINISYVFISMSKMNLTIIIVATAFVLYSRGIIKLKIRTILIGIVLLFAFFFSFPNMENFVPNTSKVFYILIFAFFYACIRKQFYQKLQSIGEKIHSVFFMQQIISWDLEILNLLIQFYHLSMSRF